VKGEKVGLAELKQTFSPFHFSTFSLSTCFTLAVEKAKIGETL